MEENKTREKSEERYHVYMLECADGSLYTGITNDLEKRLKTHNAGKASKYTRSRLPVKIVYEEVILGKNKALSREIEIKKLERTDKLKMIKR